MSRQLLRRREVLQRVALSSHQISRMIRAGRFPKPVRISDHAIAWDSAEIDAWITDRITERDINVA